MSTEKRAAKSSQTGGEKRRGTARAPRRIFTYALPIHFRLQFTFRESDVLDPDSIDPEIKPKALRALEQELTECLRQQFQVEEMEVLDDAFTAVFLGAMEE